MHTMLLYLERYNDNEIRNFDEVQAEATYVWVKQVLLGEDNFSTFNRKKRSRLSFLVFRRIRDGTNFVNNHRLNDEQNQFLLDLIQNTRQQILNSRAYLDDNNTEAIRLEDCFQPEMAMAIKKYRPPQVFTQQSEKRGTNQVFDFGSIHLDLNYNGKDMLTNMLRTDGYGIDFILASPERQLGKLPDLDLNEEINESFHLWGVDPGQVNIFTAYQHIVLRHAIIISY
ncbi:hypothetical protein MFLAVUS_011347 [Mucor flavus]|uniref:Uncharacterized protein n=1 Tax=Mucor flavus TaxID=439312 RepID=A0ABP9ZFA3_9FUNG